MNENTSAVSSSTPDNIDWTNLDFLWTVVINYGGKILGAIIILILARWVGKLIEKLISKSLAARKVEQTVIRFVGNMTSMAILAMGVLASLSTLGVQTTSFVAIIGAAGLAVGLALQGSLANFAAGFLMVIFRPFKIGDYVEIAGTQGVVNSIEIFTTGLCTTDNKDVIIPNAQVMEGVITNFSSQETRRIDLLIGVSYDADLQQTRDVLTQAVKSVEGVLEEPGTQIAVAELGDNSVNFVVRPWCSGPEYWNVRFAVLEEIKKQLDAASIGIPYPQRDVHLYQHQTEA